MRRFLSSLWFPFLMCLVMAGVGAASFALLHPGTDNLESGLVPMVQAAGWATGAVFGLLTFILIGILNLIRRILKLRKIEWLHPVAVLLGILPSLILSWVLLDEPRYTPVAGFVMDFGARPLLWASLTACLLTILCSIPLFFSPKK